MTGSGLRSPAARAVVHRFPDFFIVGHAKCGTTALYEMLRRHPRVFMPENVRGVGKEPWYFTQEGDITPGSEGARREPMSLEDYLALFAGAQSEQIIGEASTGYIWSETAPARIHAARPDARIIAAFREPASFLRSLHLELLQKGTESEPDLARAIALDEDRRHGRNVPARAPNAAALVYSDRIRYVEQLERYEALFGRERVLVLIYDDLRADNDAALRRVMRFLEIDEMALEAIEANPTVEPRSMRLRHIVWGLKTGGSPAWRALRSTGKALTTRRMRERLLYPALPRVLFRRPSQPDEQLMLELRRRFKPEVERLGEYLQRDLVALWGYDELD
jgi:hypothetical protein